MTQLEFTCSQHGLTLKRLCQPTPLGCETTMPPKAYAKVPALEGPLHKELITEWA